MAYNAIEPFGEERADLRAGIVAATTANVWRGKKDKAFKPTDFMPYYKPPQRQQTIEEQVSILSRLQTALKRKKP